jgi:imidazolonepropionase-like amidohydrolase
MLTRNVTSVAAAIVGLLLPVVLASDQAPSTQPARPTLLTRATIHTVSGETIREGSVLMSGGKIVSVGTVDVPADAAVVDCAGKHIYPGLIDSATDIGLSEIDSVRGSRDVFEAGRINPNARTQVAVNPDSEIIPTTRSNGILLAHVMSEGGLLAGTSSVMMLDGWTWEEMTLLPAAGVILNFPDMLPRQSRRNPEDEGKQAEARDAALRELDKAFDQARAYLLAVKPGPATRSANFDARWEAMRPIFDGTLPLFIRAEEAAQISAAVAFTKRQNIRCVIVGGRDADRCLDLLKAMEVPVIIGGTHRLPVNADDPYDTLYALPSKLKAAGIPFAIAGSGWTSLARNLPYQASSAVAFDLSREDALKSITLWPAQILGVDAKVGSIEAGKEATLFIADGDILEIPTRVERAWIQGREVDLNDRHKMLRDKYQKRIDATTHPSPGRTNAQDPS